MAYKLESNRGKSGWWEEDFAYLIKRLKEEVAELEKAPEDQRKQECADVANFAFMIWDNAGRHINK